MRLNSTVPNFSAETTQGKIQFYDWLGESLVLHKLLKLFSSIVLYLKKYPTR